MVAALTQHKLIDIYEPENGKVIAVCACGWKSLPTTKPVRSIDQHTRRVMGVMGPR